MLYKTTICQVTVFFYSLHRAGLLPPAERSYDITFPFRMKMKKVSILRIRMISGGIEV